MCLKFAMKLKVEWPSVKKLFLINYSQKKPVIFHSFLLTFHFFKHDMCHAFIKSIRARSHQTKSASDIASHADMKSGWGYVSVSNRIYSYAPHDMHQKVIIVTALTIPFQRALFPSISWEKSGIWILRTYPNKMSKHW